MAGTSSGCLLTGLPLRGRYKFGETFFEVDKAKAEELVAELLEVKKGKLGGIKHELAECEGKLTELKTQLYAKFGSSINLEE